MSQFSTNESISLEKRIEINQNYIKTKLEDVAFVYEVDKCAKWIQENSFQKVCLQFPDYLIQDSSEIVKQIERIINNKVYILGDTAYESCCIDYTAAKHISADAIIHFGATCFSKPENILPCLKIYEKQEINLKKLCQDLKKQFSGEEKVTVVVNTPFLHKINEFRLKLNNDKFKTCSVEDGLDNLTKIVVYVGQNDRKLLNINLALKSTELYYFDSELKKYEPDLKILKRRYFLGEKIKDASTIGVVISTLAVKNYLKLLERLKTLIKLHSKKYYIISVGKPTVAKLANFPEVDIFVVVGCALNEIYENRDFYKPIVTPYDLESSLNPNLQNVQFSYDFNRFLSESIDISEEIMKNFKENDVSLLTGNIRTSKQINDDENTENLSDKQVAIKSDGVLTVCDNFGAGFLANRSWKGLEANLGKDKPQLAQKGRVGIAQTYKHETE